MHNQGILSAYGYEEESCYRNSRRKGSECFRVIKLLEIDFKNIILMYSQTKNGRDYTCHVFILCVLTNSSFTVQFTNQLSLSATLMAPSILTRTNSSKKKRLHFSWIKACKHSVLYSALYIYKCIYKENKTLFFSVYEIDLISKEHSTSRYTLVGKYWSRGWAAKSCTSATERRFLVFPSKQQRRHCHCNCK